MSTQNLIGMIERNNRVILRQLTGVTHEESLMQPPFRGNCINWVLGHIINSHHIMLQYLGLPLVWEQATRDLYKSGSAPITGADSPHLPLEDLLRDLTTLCEQVTSALRDLPEGQFSAVVGEESATLEDLLDGLVWHETYHVGQFEYLRQMTGKNDKVI